MADIKLELDKSVRERVLRIRNRFDRDFSELWMRRRQELAETFDRTDHGGDDPGNPLYELWSKYQTEIEQAQTMFTVQQARANYERDLEVLVDNLLVEPLFKGMKKTIVHYDPPVIIAHASRIPAVSFEKTKTAAPPPPSPPAEVSDELEITSSNRRVISLTDVEAPTEIALPQQVSTPSLADQALNESRAKYLERTTGAWRQPPPQSKKGSR